MMRFTALMSTIAILFVLPLNCLGSGPEPNVLIKMASIAPKGSNIANAFEDMAKQVKDMSNNEVAFKIYWGGVQGDEKDVIRKIKLGQLHGGGFMGPGLGLIVPQVRVTEVPYMFRNYEEVAYVREQLQPVMNKQFEDKGFKVIGWMNLGFIYTFSKEPLLSLDVARRQKWWTMEGEPIGKSMFEALGISPISLSLSDVAMALSTNMINCAASTPFGAVAFQWYTKFKYMSSHPTSNILGATIISMEVWDKISPSGQKILMEVSAKSHERIMKVTREEDAKSVGLLKKAGVTIVPTDLKNKDQQFVIEVGKKVRENLVGKLYTRDLLEKTMALIEEYRRTHPKDTTVIRLE